MPQIAALLLVVIDIFHVILLSRFILDWVRALKPSFRPKGILLVLSELAYTLTDWALKPLAKVIKPIRIGGGYLDLSILALFVILRVLEGLLRTTI